MRLSDALIRSIRLLALQEAGERARVRVFGSRLDDAARGGDLDLMLEVPEPVENPALLSAPCLSGCHPNPLPVVC